MIKVAVIAKFKNLESKISVLRIDKCKTFIVLHFAKILIKFPFNEWPNVQQRRENQQECHQPASQPNKKKFFGEAHINGYQSKCYIT